MKTKPTDKLLEAALQFIQYEWDMIMWNVHQEQLDNPFANTGATWKCDMFEVEAYSWDNQYDQKYNFKCGDIEISWYKYMGRSMSVNKELTADDICKMLNICIDALNKFQEENRTVKF